MSPHLDQVLYARAGWRKRVLVPLWTFQIFVLLSLMGIFAYRLVDTFDHYDEHEQTGRVPIVEVVWETTNVGFNLAALILNMVEIARKATERLTPFLMVCTHVIKLTLAFAVLALDIVAYLERIDGHYSTVGLSLDCGLLAATLAAFAYTLATYRRLLKYEDYHLTANTKHRSYPSVGESLELAYSQNYPRQAPFPASHYPRPASFQHRDYRQHHHDPYSDDTTYASRPSQRPLQVPGNDFSSISTRTTTTTTTTTASSTITANHNNNNNNNNNNTDDDNDTVAALKRQVDRAISTEFGWTDGGAAAARRVRRSGSVVVASGRVAVHQGARLTAGPAPGGLHRMRSCVTERGVIVDGEGEEAGNGGGVMGGRDVGGGGRREEGDDGEALLAPGRENTY